MAIGVSLTQISLAQLNWYLYDIDDKLSNGRFCVQMTSDCCHGNKGGFNRNFNNIIWFPDPENPQFGANILHVSLTVPELWLVEVAVAHNANFQILGAKGVNFNFY